ncbi:universal stress protein [Streptomyces sp. NPDC059649]|uniref:universal stress protein n=1 Tax=Streptomyces sp. NPDC059649 TaxID=3346895 RepID=UPI0036D0F44B
MGIPLVVGVDGSEAGLRAVDWAVDEAVRHGVPLHVVHVAAAGDVPGRRIGRADAAEWGARERADSVIARAVARARDRAPALRPSSEVLHGDAAAELTAKGRNAFAVILGSRGTGGLTEMLLGSVSLAVAARADCPVVVVRGGAERWDSRFGNVVVGIEDGESSGTAVRFALREAHARDCGLTAVHAWHGVTGVRAEPPAPSGWGAEAHRRPPTQVLDEALSGPRQQYPRVMVSRRAVEGPARQALLEASSAADLLVVGAHRRRGHFGLQLGLVSHALLHHAPCPVAVVPQI